MPEIVDIHRKKRDIDENYRKNVISLINDQYIALSWFEGQYKPHRHNRDEFLLVIEGYLNIDVEGKKFELYPGMGILIKAGEVHSNRSDFKTLVAVFEPQNISIDYQ